MKSSAMSSRMSPSDRLDEQRPFNNPDSNGTPQYINVHQNVSQYIKCRNVYESICALYSDGVLLKYITIYLVTS